MWPQITVAAGVVATALFVLSTLPMLIKAASTKDLSSYSGSNLVIANTGNAAQALYVITLPPGPVWALHTFNTAASALMLVWWIRHREQNSRTKASQPSGHTCSATFPVASHSFPMRDRRILAVSATAGCR